MSAYAKSFSVSGPLDHNLDYIKVGIDLINDLLRRRNVINRILTRHAETTYQYQTGFEYEHILVIGTDGDDFYITYQIKSSLFDPFDGLEQNDIREINSFIDHKLQEAYLLECDLRPSHYSKNYNLRDVYNRAPIKPQHQVCLHTTCAVQIRKYITTRGDEHSEFDVIPSSISISGSQFTGYYSVPTGVHSRDLSESHRYNFLNVIESNLISFYR